MLSWLETNNMLKRLSANFDPIKAFWSEFQYTAPELNFDVLLDDD